MVLETADYTKDIYRATLIIKKFCRIMEKAKFSKKVVGGVIQPMLRSRDEIEFHIITNKPSKGYWLYKSSNGCITTNLWGGQFSNDILTCRAKVCSIDFADGCWHVNIKLAYRTKKGKFYNIFVRNDSGEYEKVY